MPFKKGNKFGRTNKSRKRPDLSERNRKGLSLKTRKKISESRKGMNIVHRENNLCPRCKSNHVISSGSNWKCVDCKKSWRKNYKKRIFKIILRNKISCPRCGSHHIKSAGNAWHCRNCKKEWMKKYKKKEDYNIKRKINISKKELKKLSKIMSQHEIAKKLGVSQGAISLFMKRHGIKAKPKYVWSNRDPKKQKTINKKISGALKGNTNWRFSHQFPNSEEKKLIRFFKRWNLPFKYVGDGSFRIDGKNPDFIWKEKKLIIEFFGELWHPESDEPKRIKFFESHDWICLVIWGKELWHGKGKGRTYPKERRLYNKIVRWLAGFDKNAY